MRVLTGAEAEWSSLSDPQRRLLRHIHDNPGWHRPAGRGYWRVVNSLVARGLVAQGRHHLTTMGWRAVRVGR